MLLRITVILFSALLFACTDGGEDLQPEPPAANLPDDSSGNDNDGSSDGTDDSKGDSSDDNSTENDPQNEDGNAGTTPEESDPAEGDSDDSESIDLVALSEQSDEVCRSTSENVNWLALQTAECKLLSQYNLFTDRDKPFGQAREPGLPYKLSVELFTDYARKYRYVFIPENTAMTFDPVNTFDFPVGSVLVKTFALPHDTALSGTENETLIETRLLIKREVGWKALPFQWVNDGADAVLAKYGALLDAELVNLQQTVNFKYEIPAVSTCNMCHQTQKDEEQASFSPIGMKARLINWSFDYDSGKQNQIEKMVALGLLNGVDQNLESIESVPLFSDEEGDLVKKAKGYLDINCAHCHSDSGQGSLSGLRLEYWRDATSIHHGICKVPPGYDGGENNLHYDIFPGRAELSILPHRMSHLAAKDMMPPIGRGTVHVEGVTLINNWIDAMPFKDCAQN